jgi:hypothetical protein
MATLALIYFWYRYTDKHDGSNSLQIFGIVVEALFWTRLFVFVTLAVGCGGDSGGTSYASKL